MAQPKVSVIVPIYGVEQYIERCARSLFEQTLDDIEYIFVDDCTKDNSVSVLGKVIEKYPSRKNKIRIIRHDINKGLPQARKTGIEAACGKYVAHCDSDDFVEKDMYEQLYQKAEELNADIVFCDLYYDGRYKNIIKAFPSDKTDKAYMNYHCCSYTGTVTMVQYFCKRSMYTENHIQYPQAMIMEDQVVTSQLRYFAKKFGYVQKPLYHYIINNNSMTNFKSLDDTLNKIWQIKENTDIIIDFFRVHNIGDNYITTLKTRSVVDLLTSIKDRAVIKTTRASFYPEINNKIIFNKEIPMVIRTRYFLLSHRLYRIDHAIRHNATLIKIILFFIH